MTASYRKIIINEKHFQDAAKIIENAPIQVGFLGEIVFEDFLETAGIEFSKYKKILFIWVIYPIRVNPN